MLLTIGVIAQIDWLNEAVAIFSPVSAAVQLAARRYLTGASLQLFVPQRSTPQSLSP